MKTFRSDRIEKIFIFAETALYLLFMALDVFGASNTSVLKYSAIVLCFLYTIFQKDCLVKIALGVTLIADAFLLFLPGYEICGVCTFLVVQALYFARLTARGKPSFVSAAIRFLTVLTAAAFLHGNLLVCLAVIYFANLAANCVEAFCRRMPLFGAGLMLFALCDICVGLSNAEFAGIPFSSKIISLGMWFFYLPSQVMIALSSRRNI